MIEEGFTINISLEYVLLIEGASGMLAWLEEGLCKSPVKSAAIHSPLAKKTFFGVCGCDLYNHVFLFGASSNTGPRTPTGEEEDAWGWNWPVFSWKLSRATFDVDYYSSRDSNSRSTSVAAALLLLLLSRATASTRYCHIVCRSSSDLKNTMKLL